MKSKLLLSIVYLSLIFAQTISVKAQQGLRSYHVVNRSMELIKDSGIVRLNATEGVGIAWIKGEQFKEGIIEFDIKGKDAFQDSFVGIAFHGLNDTTYESIYFRPFNFRATDPVRKAHAVQYIANPAYDWPKLREEFPNQYERPVSPDIDPNDWFHVKISVVKDRITVYIANTRQPVLSVRSLLRRNGWKIGLWAGNGSDGSWKNLKLTHK